MAILLPDLMSNNGTRYIHCSGSILSEKTVLTAAHCFGSEDKDLMTIIVGSSDPTNNKVLRANRKNIQQKKIKSVKVHPLYDQKLYPSMYDIALVEIEGRFTFKKSIWPICIPDGVYEKDEHVDKGYLLLGFGEDTVNEEKGEVLTAESLFVQPTAACNQLYGPVLSNQRYGNSGYLYLRLPA